MYLAGRVRLTSSIVCLNLFGAMISLENMGCFALCEYGRSIGSCHVMPCFCMMIEIVGGIWRVGSYVVGWGWVDRNRLRQLLVRCSSMVGREALLTAVTAAVSCMCVCVCACISRSVERRW